MTGDPCDNNWAGVTCDVADVIQLQLVFFFFFLNPEIVYLQIFTRYIFKKTKFAFFSSSYFSLFFSFLEQQEP